VTNSASWRTRLAAFLSRDAGGHVSAIIEMLAINSQYEPHRASLGPNKASTPPVKSRKGANKKGSCSMLSAAKVTLALAIVLASGSMTWAGNYSSKAAKLDTSPYQSSTSEPRMIEVRPGLWISSYDCVTDDGNGRYRSCSAN
jgi:hypothetical protein